jgi:hypothetical protein
MSCSNIPISPASGDGIYCFSPPPSGPGPVSRVQRKSDGTVVVLDRCCSLTGRALDDYTNPLLKPEAAEVVRKSGDFQFRGEVTPNLHRRGRRHSHGAHAGFLSTWEAEVCCGSDSAVAATLAARPVYPRKLTTCCNAQVVSLGPLD